MASHRFDKAGNPYPSTIGGTGRRKRRTRAEIERDRIAALSGGVISGKSASGPGFASGPRPGGTGNSDGKDGEPASSAPAPGGVEFASGQTQETAQENQILVEGGAPLTPEEEEKRQKRLDAAKAYKLRKKAEAAGKDNQTVLMLIAILDGLAESAIGPEARLEPYEREMIEGPLTRILNRMDSGTQELINTWTDPITLVVGLGFWVSRIMGIEATKRQAQQRPAPTLEYRPPEPEAVTFKASDNGSGESVAAPPAEVLSAIDAGSIQLGGS